MRLVYANAELAVYRVTLASGQTAFIREAHPETAGGLGWGWHAAKKATLRFIKRRSDGRPSKGLLGGQKYIEASPMWKRFRLSTVGDKTFGILHGRGFSGKGDHIEGVIHAIPHISYEKGRNGTFSPVTKYVLRVKIDRATGVLKKASRKAVNVSNSRLTADEVRVEVKKMLKSTKELVDKLKAAHEKADEQEDPFEEHGEHGKEANRNLHLDALDQDRHDELLDRAEEGEVPFSSRSVYNRVRNKKGDVDDDDDDEDSDDDFFGGRVAANPEKIRKAAGAAHLEEYIEGRTGLRDGEMASSSVPTMSTDFQLIELASKGGAKRTLMRPVGNVELELAASRPRIKLTKTDRDFMAKKIGDDLDEADSQPDALAKKLMLAYRNGEKPGSAAFRSRMQGVDPAAVAVGLKHLKATLDFHRGIAHDKKGRKQAADLVVLSRDGYILLIKRKAEPFAGKWALPGGFINRGEKPDLAAKRELREETGVNAGMRVRRVGVYAKPGRDPRYPIKSHAYWTVLSRAQVPKAGDDAAAAKWVKLDAAAGLAFDHDRILRDALKLWRETLKKQKN